jgi:hypothetical protein
MVGDRLGFIARSGKGAMTTVRSHPTAATACVLAALLAMSGAGLADAAIACVCPDGGVEVEAAVCSCCQSDSSDGLAIGDHPASSEPSCDACVDVSLQVLSMKSGSLHLESAKTDAAFPGAPLLGMTRCEQDRISRPDQGHRLALALLSAAILLT